MMYAIELSFVIITLLAFVLGLYFKKASIKFLLKVIMLVTPLLAVFYFLALEGYPKLWVLVPVFAIASVMGLLTKKKNFKIINLILLLIVTISIAYWIIPDLY